LFYDIPMKLVLRKRTPGDPTRKGQVEEDFTEDTINADDESLTSADWAEIVLDNRTGRPRSDEDEEEFVQRWLSKVKFGEDDEAFEAE
jgi:hypothetical protein